MQDSLSLKHPHPHQAEALAAIANAGQIERATVVMACGTGKTLVELWATQRLAPRRAIVFVPTLYLLRQTLHEWRDNNEWGDDFAPLCVCSDASIGRALPDDEIELSREDLDFPTCTDPAVVNEYLDQLARRPGLSRAVVFCTYQSAPVVGAAMALRAPDDRSFDVGIFDEAHKTVGDAGKAFAFALQDAGIQIRRRLFFTATPRVVEGRQSRDEDGNLRVSSMDNEAVYGPQVHTLSFAEAARRGIIVPYKVLITVIDSASMTADHLSDAVVREDGSRLDAAMVANQIALRKAMDEKGLNKAITFHRTVAAAKDFSYVASRIDGANLDGMARFHVSGHQTGTERALAMQAFKSSPRAIISNARCLTEGVDVPAVDIVAFMDPRRSKVDSVQAAGRAMRLDGPNKEYGYVLLPLHVNLGLHESVNEAIARSDFSVIAEVLQALSENDEVLHNTIRESVLRMGRGDEAPFPGQVEIHLGDLPAHEVTAQQLLRAIQTRVINETGDGWFVWLGRMQAFQAEHGHCDVPSKYKTADGFALGAWRNNQRQSARSPSYPSERREALEALGFDFSVQNKDDLFERGRQALAAFQAEHGHCNVPYDYKTADGFALGTWCNNQRQSAKSPAYPAERREALEAMGFDFESPLDAKFERGRQALAAFQAEHGHCDVPRAYKTADGFALGRWYRKQRQRAKSPAYPAERREALLALGFDFRSQNKTNEEADLAPESRPAPDSASPWESFFTDLAAFQQKTGHCNVPLDHDRLGVWTANQIWAMQNGHLDEDRMRRLMALGLGSSRPAPSTGEQIDSDGREDEDDDDGPAYPRMRGG